MIRHLALLNRIFPRRGSGFVGIWESSTGQIEIRSLGVGRMAMAVNADVGRCNAHVSGRTHRRRIFANGDGEQSFLRLEFRRAGNVLIVNDRSMGQVRLCNPGTNMNGRYLRAGDNS